MFTIKLHHTINDYWEVYNATRYKVETDHDPHTGQGTRALTLLDADDEKILLTHVSYEDEDWDAAYIVNDLGNTVDRVHPPRAKKIPGMLTCEACGETAMLLDKKGFCPDCVEMFEEAIAQDNI